MDAFQLIEKVRERFRTWMGEEIFKRRRRQILFAIAVDSIECWLLPLFYETVKSKREKTANCLATLNQALNKKYKFTIDKKERDYYDRASTDYNDQRTLRRLYEYNPSLKAFIEELDQSEIGCPLRA